VLIGLFVVATTAGVRAQAPADWTHSQRLDVTMVDDRFIPTALTLRHGTPYVLHMENRGKELHEFTAPEFFAASIVREPKLLANGGQDVVMQPGTKIDVYVLPLKAGAYRLICADHDWAGMIGEITVE